MVHPLHDMLSRYQEADSWYPMLEALKAKDAPAGIYQTVFFDQQTKFQYPLASLIPVALLRALCGTDSRALDTLKWLSIFAFLAQVPCVYAILSRGFREPQSRKLTVALAVLLVVSFYPVARAYAAGQIQIFLDLLFSAAFLSWIDKKDRLSGFLIGLSVLVKPQYGLFLLWAVIRKNWKFLVAAAAPLAIGAVLGIVVYGWRNNLQYVEVIRYMGRHGEAYYPNQTVNGLLNRLLRNGSNTRFEVHGFAPYLPTVYVLTVITAVALIALAILSKTPETEFGRVAEFGVVAIAATAASPIAWEHHYGILLPVFAGILPQIDKLCHKSAGSVLVLITFVLCADDLRMTTLLADLSPWNVLQSTLLVGAIILFAVLRGTVRARVIRHQVVGSTYSYTVPADPC